MTAASTAPVRGRRWPLALGLLAVAIVGVLALIASRNLIARALARSWLKGQGVTSALEVRELSLTGLKARVRLGDPAAPDLSVDEVDVRYAITGPWNGEPLDVVTRSVRLVRPELTLRWDGRRLTYGSMTRLVDDILKQPANPRRPPPQIIVQGGLIHLQTPYGPLAARADAVVENGALQSLQGMMEPARLTRNGAVLATAGGPVVATRSGAALKIQALAPVDEVRFGRLTARGARLSLGGVLPATLDAGGRVSLVADLSADDLGLDAVAVQRASLRATLDGALVRAGVRAGDALGLTGSGRLSASLAVVRSGGGEARAVSADVALSQIDLRSGTRPGWRANVSGQASADALAASGVRLSRTRMLMAGQVADSGFALRGGATSDGALDPARTAALGSAFEALNPGYALAARRAGQRFALAAPALSLTGNARSLVLAASAPVRLTSASGATLVISPDGGEPLARTAGGAASGAFDLDLKGGGLPEASIRAASWRAGPGGGQATLAVRAAGDAGPARGATVVARGTLNLSAGTSSFALADCAAVTAGAVALAGQTAETVTARLCPDGPAPLWRTNGGGWRLAGRFQDAAGTLAQAGVRLRRGAGAFSLGGGRAGALNGVIDLTSLEAEDTAAARRFEPASAEGRLTIAGGQVRGRFQAGTAAARRLADITLVHDLGAGVGHAEVRAEGLVFAKGGLQPAAISPLAAFAREAQGRVDVGGRFDWTPTGVTSSGQVSTAGLDFKSPLGMVRGAAGTIRLANLAPLVTAPGQTLTAKAVDALVPLTDGAATFQLDADGLSLASADAAAAKGKVSLEPMRIGFGDAGEIEGALLLSHVDLGEILAASSLADSVKIEMIVDGRLPFAVGPAGFRFLQGHITAAQPGRISIARSALTGLNAGAASSTGPAVNAVQDLAYQALENLAFDTLEADVASRPNGRLGMNFRIKGRFDPPKRQEAVLGISDVLSGKAFQKAIPLPSDTPIDLNLDTSLNFDELMRSLSTLWRQDADNSAAVQAAKP